MRIGIYLEFDDRKLTAESSELLALARTLAGPEEIVAFAAGTVKADLNGLPTARIYTHADAAFGSEIAEAVVKCQEAFSLFFCCMTLNGREVGAGLSSLLGCELIGGVSGYCLTSDGLELTRLTAGGLTQEEKVYHISESEPLVLGIVPGLWGGELETDGQAEVLPLPIASSPAATLEREYLAPWTEIAVGEAELVVAGGNGMRDRETFDRLYELGESLAAPIGGSRVAEDKGWIEHRAMIGATGSAIAPKLYLACGISGAVQHLVGVQAAERIIAVNTDAMCAMMQQADLAVQGDVAAIVPLLAAELKKYKRTEEV